MKKILLFLSAVVLLPLIPLIFGYFPATGDMRDVFIPIESFFRTQQLRGSIPAWNPAVSFGFPVIASAQIGFFYPVLFVLRFLPIWLELPVALIVHVSLCAIGMYLFARRFKLSTEASVLTAISFSLSQFLWQHVTHLNIFLAVAWFPWQMWAVDILFRKARLERRGIVALIAIFGIPFLIGQIQIPFLMMAVALIYGVYLRVSHSLTSSPSLLLRKEKGGATSPLLTKERLGEVMSTVAVVALICIATFLLASVQLLPTLELAKLSSRATDTGFDIVRANQHSYPLYHLPTFLFPKFFGTDNTYWGKRLEIEYGTYIGVIPLLLAIWYLWRVRFKGGFFVYLLVISFLLCLGDLSPFRLIGIEPSLWFFSAPARWLLFTTFSLSLFAGFGFDAVWQSVEQSRKILQRIAGILIFFVIAGNIVLYFAPEILSRATANYNLPATAFTKISSLIQSAQTSSISLTSPYIYIVLVSLLILPYALSHKHGKKILLAITILDLAIIAGTTTPLISWKNILTPPTTLKNLPEQVKNHQARIYSIRDGGDNGAYFTDPSSRADMAKRELQRNLLVPMVSAQFGIYGIEWPASLDLTEQGAVLERLHPTKPYAVEDTELAKDLTIGAVLFPTTDGKVDIAMLESKPRFEVVNGTAELLSEKPSELIIKTTSEKDSKLIVRDTFYPGWRAYDDDYEIPIQKSPLFFRSIAVRAGTHTVSMKYQPKMLYIGGIVSLVTLGLMIALFIKKEAPVRTKATRGR